MSYIALLSKYIVTIILLIGAIGKLSDVKQFRETLISSIDMPHSLTLILAFSVIAIEFSLAIFFFTLPENFFIISIATFFLFLAFSVFLLFNLLKNRVIQCNCFGRSEDPVNWWDLIRNTIILGLCLVVAFYYNPGLSMPYNLKLLVIGCSLIWVQFLVNLPLIASILRINFNRVS